MHECIIKAMNSTIVWLRTNIRTMNASSGPILHTISVHRIDHVYFSSILGEIGPPPIMLICISSGSEFHRDSESEVRNLKFYL